MYQQLYLVDRGLLSAIREAGSIELLHEKVLSLEPIGLDGAGLLSQILTRERNMARCVLLMVYTVTRPPDCALRQLS